MMKSNDLQYRQPKRVVTRLLITGLLALAIASITVIRVYPQYQARRWEEKLVTTPDAFQAHHLIGEILRAENAFADEMLANHCDRVENAVFAKEHRAVLLVSNDTGQPYSVSRWVTTTRSPNITARFAHPHIVENQPDAVTIAVTNQVNGLKYLFVFSYRHIGHVCDLSDEDFEMWKQTGFWNHYVQTHGDPNAVRRQEWTPHEEKRYRQWKKVMEEQFARRTAE